MKGDDVVIFPPFELVWQKEHKIFFDYSAKPTDGLYFTGWNDPAQIKRKQIWAQRPNHWLPYASAILTVEMAVTVDDNLKVFSNGVRESVVTNKDKTKTWHYRMNHPHPFFSTCLVIGDYEYKSLKTDRGLPIELWYYPDWSDHFEPTYLYQTKMFDFFEDEFGFNYPWELYRQAPVIDYMYGAMETTTSTVFGDFLMVDKRGFMGRNYVNVNSHELAHQWFGNYISHLKTKDVWLTESFATYYAKKFEQSVFGEDYFQNVRNTELLDTYMAAKRNNFGVGHASGGRERFYPKGSLVMDMLRNVMGAEEFKLSIKNYLETFPYQTAETSDFLQTIRQTTGRSMEWFFEEWIYRGGEPVYKVNYEKVTNENGIPETRIYVEQTHETNDLIGLFRMPIDFEVYYKDGSVDLKNQSIEKKFEEVIIPNPENKVIDFVIFDPNRKIIKKLDFARSYQELASQALKAGNMIDRYDALLALRDFSLELKKNAISDSDDKVRLVVLQNLTLVPETLGTEYEKFLTDSSYVNVELALENLCSSFPEKVNDYLEITKNETGWRGRNIRIKWLEISLENGKNEHFDELKSYITECYEFETRINAMAAIKRLNLPDEEMIGNMLKALFHWNYKIRNAAAENLQYFYKQSAGSKMIETAIYSGNWTSAQLSKFQTVFVN
jgi:aminopeptidase N